MINMSDVVGDLELAAPQPYTILRSTGQWTRDGFVSTTVSILQAGPVQRAGDKEVQMLPEADRVGALMVFWSQQPIFTTRGKIEETAMQGVVPQGAYPGTAYAVYATVPAGAQVALYKNGLFQMPGVDYTYAGNTITMTMPTGASDSLYLTWNDATAGAAESDILQYQREQYRVLAVRHYPGSGYWRAVGTRLSTI